jgi:hypothetical protein
MTFLLVRFFARRFPQALGPGRLLQSLTRGWLATVAAVQSQSTLQFRPHGHSMPQTSPSVWYSPRSTLQIAASAPRLPPTAAELVNANLRCLSACWAKKSLTQFRSRTPGGRLPQVIGGRYRVRERCLRQVGDVVVVSEFKELYQPSSIFSSSPGAPGAAGPAMARRRVPFMVAGGETARNGDIY